jgi:uncharacterized protein YdhG (YjbR/CyaY superfamily)
LEDYLDELPEDRRKALSKLRTLIRKTAPDAAESIQYGMPSYTLGEMLHFLVLELGAALAPCHLVDAEIVLQRVHAGDV